MNNWKKIKVSDIGRIVTGKTPKTAEKDNYGGDIPFLTPSDDLSEKYVYKTIKNITEKGMNSVKGAIIPASSVCVSCIGSDLGKVVITTKQTVTNQQINSIVVNKDLFDTDFIYYSMLVLGRFLNYHSKTSTAVPIINKSTFSNYEINCPDLKTQRQIGKILACLDSKIDVNKQINDNLLQQLHSVYHHTFNKPEMDALLGDVVETTSGGTPSRKHSEYYMGGSICWVKSKELLCGYIHDTEEHINSLAIDNSSAKILPSHSVLIAMYGATVGAYAITSKPMSCNQAVCALLSNSQYPYTYLFQLAQESQQKLINLAVGSAQQNVSQVLIKQLHLHSDLDAIQAFHSIAYPIHKKLELLQEENTALALLRDALLPRLMSGEIDVSDIEL